MRDDFCEIYLIIMRNTIIYQVEEKPTEAQEPSTPTSYKQTLCQRLCSCLTYWQWTKDKQRYALEIDSPKYLTPSSKRKRKTLVLDLDETLVHSAFQNAENWDLTVDITVQGICFKIFVSVRPGAVQFITRMAKLYDIIFFTASLREYADPVMDALDPKRKAVQRLFREHCIMIDGHLVKDLRILQRDLSEVIIVDNSELSYKLQPENALPIKDYFYDKKDNELPKMEPFLEWIAQADDVRHVGKLKEKFKQDPLSSPNFIVAQEMEEIPDSGKVTRKNSLNQLNPKGSKGSGRCKTLSSIDPDSESISPMDSKSQQKLNSRRKILTELGD